MNEKRVTTPPATNIAGYAVDLVAALGSDTVFSLTGGMAMHLNRAAAAHGSLKCIYCQHEQACVAAAEGYAKAADFRRAGFAIVTAGPGVSNTVTSLISAYGDSTPLVVLAGQIKTADIDRFGTRTHGIQEIRSREIISSCVKRFARLDADRHRELLRDTLVEAFSGRPGPVFIEIPLDVQGMPFAYGPAEIAEDASQIRRRVAAEAETIGDHGLTGALRALLSAERPLLYVGNGCRIAGMESTIRTFIENHRLPTVFSWLSFDIISGREPLHFGCPGGLAPISANEILSKADTILFLGARLDLGTTAFQREAFGPQAARYYVDIDAAELAKFSGFPRTHAIRADLRLLPAAIRAAGPAGTSDPGWLKWCEERRSGYLAEERRRLTSQNMNVYGVTARLSAWSDDKTFVPASSGYAEETFSRFFVPGNRTRFFNGAALGAMGLGLPQAIGAAFGSARRVVCLEADGGIMLNLQELATLSQYAPRGFVLFILNNGGYESIRSSQKRFFGSANGADRESGVFIPDFRDVAHTFGLRYERVQSLESLGSLLDVLAPDQPPIMVDLIIDKAEPRGPAVRTVIDEQGRPSSTPLAEISW
jgi:acetolactate synthase-1/2/3 large subunit